MWAWVKERFLGKTTINEPEAKPKIDMLNFIKLKNYYISKDTIKKMKRQATEYEKNICKVHIL